MDDIQKRRLEHYLMNATNFMWDIGPGNQRKNYRWLEINGFKFAHGKYHLVIKQLVHDPGIEQIINKLIIPTVTKQFPEKTIEVLRNLWNAGERPTLWNIGELSMTIARKFPIYEDVFYWRPFVRINIQTPKFSYVEGWGEFAGVWFEEIEPYLKITGEN